MERSVAVHIPACIHEYRPTLNGSLQLFGQIIIIAIFQRNSNYEIEMLKD